MHCLRYLQSTGTQFLLSMSVFKESLSLTVKIGLLNCRHTNSQHVCYNNLLKVSNTGIIKYLPADLLSLMNAEASEVTQKGILISAKVVGGEGEAGLKMRKNNKHIFFLLVVCLLSMAFFWSFARLFVTSERPTYGLAYSNT